MYRWFGESASFVLGVRLSVCTTVHLRVCERGVRVSVFRFASLCGDTPAHLHPKILRGPGHRQPILAAPDAPAVLCPPHPPPLPVQDQAAFPGGHAG